MRERSVYGMGKKIRYKKGEKVAAVFVSAALLAACLTACGDDSSSSTTSQATESSQAAENSESSAAETQTAELTDFSIGYLPSTGHLLYFVAKEEGFFEKEGLNVTLKLFDSNNNMLSSFEAGQIDAGAIGASEVVSYVNQGYDVTEIGGIMTEGHALLVKKEVVEGVDPSDYSLDLLRGKRIAVVPLGTQDIVWRTGFENAGIHVGTDVEFVDVDSGTAAYAALSNDDIDGALVFTPFRALGENDGYVIFDYSGEIEGFENHPCCRNLVETEKLNANPDLYVRYLKALIEAYKFYQENEDETVADIVKYVDVDADIIKQETYGEHISSYPDPDKKSLIAWKDAMVNLGYFDDFDLESHINTDLYKTALDAVIEENPDDADFYEAMVSHYEEYDT